MPSAWITASDPLLRLPSVPGCYAIIFEGRTQYVGQTCNLQSRIKAYKIRPGYGLHWIWVNGFVKTRITVKFRPSRRYGDWLMVEARLIRRLQPPMNCSGSVRPRKKMSRG